MGALSAAEVLVLVGLVGGQVVIGLDDPFRGRPAAEVERRLREAGERLRARGLLSQDADDLLAIDPAVQPLVETLAHPERVFVAIVVVEGATIAPRQTGQRHVYALRPPHAVELQAGPDGYRLSALDGEAGLAARLIETSGISLQLPASGVPVVLPQASLHTAADVARTDPLACRAHLEAAGCAPAALDALVDTLVQPRRNVALMVGRTDGLPGEALGLGLLDGPAGLWRLRPVEVAGQPGIELAPCAGMTLAQLVRDFVRLAEPDPAANIAVGERFSST